MIRRSLTGYALALPKNSKFLKAVAIGLGIEEVVPEFTGTEDALLSSPGFISVPVADFELSSVAPIN